MSIEKKLRASVQYGAIDGNAHERGVCAAQMVQAASEIDSLRKRVRDLEAAVADEKARHARKIERARPFLKSLMEHAQIAGRSRVRLSTSYYLAKSALTALDGEEGEGESS